MAQGFFKETVPNFLENMKTLLESRGGRYFAGNKLSIADVAVVQFLDYLRDHPFDESVTPGHEMKKEIPENYPELYSLQRRVHEQPGLTKYLANRKWSKAFPGH